MYEKLPYKIKQSLKSLFLRISKDKVTSIKSLHWRKDEPTEKTKRSEIIAEWRNTQYKSLNNVNHYKEQLTLGMSKMFRNS